MNIHIQKTVWKREQNHHPWSQPAAPALCNKRAFYKWEHVAILVFKLYWVTSVWRSPTSLCSASEMFLHLTWTWILHRNVDNLVQTQICAPLLTFQNFPSNAASPFRKCSPVGPRVHQTARERGVSSPTWRESQRGGVQLRGPGTPTPLLQVTMTMLLLMMMGKVALVSHLWRIWLSNKHQ